MAQPQNRGKCINGPIESNRLGANAIQTVLTDQEKTMLKCRHRIIVLLNIYEVIVTLNRLQNNVRVTLNLCLTVYLES